MGNATITAIKHLKRLLNRKKGGYRIIHEGAQNSVDANADNLWIKIYGNTVIIRDDGDGIRADEFGEILWQLFGDDKGQGDNGSEGEGIKSGIAAAKDLKMLVSSKTPFQQDVHHSLGYIPYDKDGLSYNAVPEEYVPDEVVEGFTDVDSGTAVFITNIEDKYMEDISFERAKRDLINHWRPIIADGSMNVHLDMDGKTETLTATPLEDLAVDTHTHSTTIETGINAMPEVDIEMTDYQFPDGVQPVERSDPNNHYIGIRILDQFIKFQGMRNNLLEGEHLISVRFPNKDEREFAENSNHDDTVFDTHEIRKAVGSFLQQYVEQEDFDDSNELLVKMNSALDSIDHPFKDGGGSGGSGGGGPDDNTDLFASISTGQWEYGINDPVDGTVTLKNETDEPVQFVNMKLVVEGEYDGSSIYDDTIPIEDTKVEAGETIEIPTSIISAIPQNGYYTLRLKYLPLDIDEEGLEKLVLQQNSRTDVLTIRANVPKRSSNGLINDIGYKEMPGNTIGGVIGNRVVINTNNPCYERVKDKKTLRRRYIIQEAFGLLMDSDMFDEDEHDKSRAEIRGDLMASVADYLW